MSLCFMYVRLAVVDELCVRGITTAVMGAPGSDVVDELWNVLANSGSAANSVRIVRTTVDDADVFGCEKGRIWVVDTGDSVQKAVEVLKEAERRLGGIADCTKARLANKCGEEMSALLRGVLVWGGDAWGSILPTGKKDMSDLMGLPRQSCSGETVVGMVVWEGKGLVRCDRRKKLTECCAPGEGALDIEGVVAEMLAKTCVVPKFGA